MKNPYETLGLPTDADKAAIDKAYRAMVKKHHPDAGGSPDRFDEVHRAVAVLRDPLKRKRFDGDGHVDETVDNMRGLAIGCIEAFISDKMNGWERGTVDPRTIDMVAEMKLEFMREISAGNAALAAAETLRPKIKDIMSRFKTKDPQQLVRKLFEDRLRQLDRQIESFKQVMEVRKVAIEIISTYSFEFEKAQKTTFTVNMDSWRAPISKHNLS